MMIEENSRLDCVEEKLSLPRLEVETRHRRNSRAEEYAGRRYRLVSMRWYYGELVSR
jgi:hypothetical protein